MPKKVTLITVPAALALSLSACGGSAIAAPRDSQGQATTAQARADTAKVRTAKNPKDCDALGINRTQLREGNCVSDGRKLKVVNRGTTLRLRELTVKLESIAPTTTIPRPYDSPLVGSYIVARVTIKSRLKAPVSFDGSDVFTLTLGKRRYTPDFDAMNTGTDDALVGAELQPDQRITGAVVFDVAKRRWHALGTSGNLIVLQFSDAADNSRPAKKRIGVIRTYH
jgi:Domain of unknown function (DUF4352)